MSSSWIKGNHTVTIISNQTVSIYQGPLSWKLRPTDMPRITGPSGKLPCRTPCLALTSWPARAWMISLQRQGRCVLDLNEREIIAESLIELWFAPGRRSSARQEWLQRGCPAIDQLQLESSPSR